MDLYACWHIAYPRWFRTSASYDINMLLLISGPPRRGPQWVNISVLQQLPCTCLYFRHGNLQTQNLSTAATAFKSNSAFGESEVFVPDLELLEGSWISKGSLANSETQAFPGQISLEMDWQVKFEKDAGYFCFLTSFFFSVIRPDIKQTWSWQSCSRSRKQDGEPKSAQKVKCIPKAIHYLSGRHPYLLQNFSIKHLHDLKEIILHYSNK